MILDGFVVVLGFSLYFEKELKVRCLGMGRWFQLTWEMGRKRSKYIFIVILNNKTLEICDKENLNSKKYKDKIIKSLKDDKHD